MLPFEFSGCDLSAGFPGSLELSLRIQAFVSQTFNFFFPLFLFVVNDSDSRQEVSKKKDKERKPTHQHLPLCAVWVAGQSEQCDGVGQLPKVTKEQEWQQEGQASPHPGLKPLHSQVHVVPLSQRAQSVQAATLIVILQELHKVLIHGI